MTIKNSLFYFFISFFLRQSCSSQKESKKKIDKYQKTELNALQIILKNDCLQCHSLEDKVVGPPYLNISRRYKEHPEIKTTLVNKIREGGGGLWYGGMMSGHPLLKKSDVNKIVTWVLSLDEKHNNYNSAILENEVKVELTKGIEQKDQQGVLLEVFNLDNPISLFSSFEKNTNPAYSSKVKSISLNGSLLSTELEASNVLKFSRNINISQKENTFSGYRKQVRVRYF